MLTINLPSAGIRIKFDKMWSVARLADGIDEVIFQEGEYLNSQIASFVTFFPSMWSVARYLAKKENPRLIPDGPYAYPFTFPDGMAWSDMYAHVPSTRPYGRVLSYNDGYNDWTTTGILCLFEYMVGQAEDSEAGSIILGALHRNYVVDHFFYLAAAKTGHCVRCDLSTMKWEAYEGTPEGMPSVSSVGITSYITEGDKAPALPQLIIGVNLLTSSVAIDYSVDLLKDVPEAMFQGLPFASELEQALPLTTNRNRLFYLLNTDRDVPEAQSAPEPTLEKAELPSIKWQSIPTNGTRLLTGGAVLVEGGNGEYEMYDVVKWLSDAYDAYGLFASRFEDSHLSKLAKQQFEEKFGTTRVDVSPSKLSTSVPLQLAIGPITYGWDDARWFPIMGSQRLNPEEYDSFRYINMRVTMSTAVWLQLIKTLIDQFCGPMPGLDALYYLNEDVPDEGSAYDGELRLVDHWCMQEFCYAKGKWSHREATPYSSEALLTETGIAIDVSGVGSISSKELASLLVSVHTNVTKLLEDRFGVIDDLCKDTAFGTYELLHQCMPADMFSLRAIPASGLVGNIVSPIVLYKDNQRLSNTSTGWHINNVAHDRAKKAGKAGDYQVAYETGTFAWDGIATVIKDFLELTLDYSAPAVVAAIELEHAQ